MKKLLLFLVSLLLGVGLFGWAISFIGWGAVRDAFLVFTGWQGLIILGLTLLTALIGNWKWKEILKTNNVNISFLSLWRIYLASFSIRFLAPVILIGAEVFQGYALREKHQIPWSKGVASVIIDRILEWTANLLVLFLGILFFLYKTGLPPRSLGGMMFGGALLILAAGVAAFYFKSFKGESIIKMFVRNNQNQPHEIEKEIFNFFKPPRKLLMWKVIFLSFLRAAVMYLRAWFLIIFLGKTIGVLPVLSILGFTYLAAIIPIPAALGSHELIQASAFNSFGLGIPTAAAFTMIIRGAEFLLALAGLIFLFQLGTNILKNLYVRHQ